AVAKLSGAGASALRSRRAGEVRLDHLGIPGVVRSNAVPVEEALDIGEQDAMFGGPSITTSRSSETIATSLTRIASPPRSSLLRAARRVRSDTETSTAVSIVSAGPSPAAVLRSLLGIRDPRAAACSAGWAGASVGCPQAAGAAHRAASACRGDDVDG